MRWAELALSALPPTGRRLALLSAARRGTQTSEHDERGAMHARRRPIGRRACAQRTLVATAARAQQQSIFSNSTSRCRRAQCWNRRLLPSRGLLIAGKGSKQRGEASRCAVAEARPAPRSSRLLVSSPRLRPTARCSLRLLAARSREQERRFAAARACSASALPPSARRLTPSREQMSSTDEPGASHSASMHHTNREMELSGCSERRRRSCQCSAAAEPRWSHNTATAPTRAETCSASGRGGETTSQQQRARRPSRRSACTPADSLITEPLS